MGDTVALYNYDPYGRIVSSSGSYYAYNRYRFSTKWHEYEAGFSYYGYRHYSPDLGRWIKRDPIGERGGLNLYGFVQNEPVDKYDVLGLRGGGAKGKPCCKCGPDIEQGLVKTMLAVNKKFKKSREKEKKRKRTFVANQT